MLDNIRFYNGQSSPFQQKFIYTKPDTDFKEENGIAYFSVDAKPKNFFKVPFEMLTGDGGTWRISVHKEITERFGERGIIRVEPGAKAALVEELSQKEVGELREMAEQRGLEIPVHPTAEILADLLAVDGIMKSDPRFTLIAYDDACAKAKGDALWKAYLRKQIDDFEYENQRRVTERGITPLRPNGFVMHAYRELGMEVPGDEKFIKAGVQKTDVTELQDTVKKQQEQIDKLLKALETKTGENKPPASEAGDPELTASGKGHKSK